MTRRITERLITYTAALSPAAELVASTLIMGTEAFLPGSFESRDPVWDKIVSSSSMKGCSVKSALFVSLLCVVALAATPNCVNDDDSSNGEERRKCGCELHLCGYMDEYSCCDPAEETCCGDAPTGNQLCCPSFASICVNCDGFPSHACAMNQTSGSGYGCCPTSATTLSVPCSGHGVCYMNITSVERGAVVCKCTPGYSGFDCSVQDGV